MPDEAKRLQLQSGLDEAWAGFRDKYEAVVRIGVSGPRTEDAILVRQMAHLICAELCYRKGEEPTP